MSPDSIYQWFSGFVRSLSKRIRWTTLREVGSLWAVKLTVLIPVIGYLVLFNATIVEYLQLSPELGGYAEGAGEIGHRLLLIYFGLCFIAAGSVLYTWRCPPVIKRYENGSAFVAAEIDYLGKYDKAGIRVTLKRINEEAYQNLRKRLRESASRLGKDFNERSRDDTIEFMQWYFREGNQHNPFMRMLISALFTVGFGFLAMPSVEVFYKCLLLLLGIE